MSFLAIYIQPTTTFACSLVSLYTHFYLSHIQEFAADRFTFLFAQSFRIVDLYFQEVKLLSAILTLLSIYLFITNNLTYRNLFCTASCLPHRLNTRVEGKLFLLPIFTL